MLAFLDQDLLDGAALTMADGLAIVFHPDRSRRHDGAVDLGDRREERETDDEDADHEGALSDRALQALLENLSLIHI